jgi:hypothetical protein
MDTNTYKVNKQIGDVNVYQYDYDYVDYDTEETKQGFLTFIDFNEIQTKYKEEFDKWLYGQTMPVIPNVRGAIYSWDWERWYNLKTKGIPTYFD